MQHKADWTKDLNTFYFCQSLVRVRMAARKVSAGFCLDDPAFSNCESEGTNAPSIALVFELLEMPWGVWSLIVWMTFKYLRSAIILIARVEKRTNQPPNKGHVSLKGKEKARSKDPFSEVTTNEVLAELSKGYIPPNTEKNTGWAMRVFEQW